MSISPVKETDTKQRDRVWVGKHYLGSALTLKSSPNACFSTNVPLLSNVITLAAWLKYLGFL